MKGTLLYILLLFFNLTALCQEGRITIASGQYTLLEALEIAKSQGIPLAYSSDLLPKSQCVFNKSEYSANAFLDVIMDQTGINIQKTQNLIVISYLPSTVKFFTIRGSIRDKASGEVLIGASINKMNTTQGVVTNNYGFYSLSLAPGSHIVNVNYLGYKPIIDTIDLSSTNQQREYRLEPIIEQLQEVVVSAYEPDINITSLVPGTNTINLNSKGQIPYFLGEVDVLQGATLLPGINTLGEDANGLSIRGGNVDQNLILLDEATVYNPNHLYGLISIFNPEAVNKIEVMKGFIPPSYGGRASSVITVHQKEGDYDSYHLTGGIGIVSAKLIAEGPIKREKSSFIISGRQSLFNISQDENSTNNFQDVNMKVNWKYNPKNTFYYSGYFGNDRSTNTFETVRNWGNQNHSFRWNHHFSPRVFSNFSAILSQYTYRIIQPREAASFIGQSKIIDYTLKSDWSFVINDNHEVNFGGSSVFHRLKPGERIPFDENSSSDTLLLDQEYGLESALYISHEAQLFSKFKVLYGLRASSLRNLGAGTVYTYSQNRPMTDESILDTTYYDRMETIKYYPRLEPRASLVYKWNNQFSTKLSYSRVYQYLHLISNTITPAPTDIWKLSDSFIKPTESNHYSLGLFFNLKNNQYEAYVDGYYKSMNHLVEYKNGADLLFNENPETELLNGFGRNYGVEFFLKKNEGKLTGWLSYTLSRSEVKISDRFSSVNSGAYFPSNFDRKHDLSAVAIYDILPRLSGSLSFNYNSGRPFTLPLGRYIYEGNLIPHFGNRNQNRLPDYHRLDLSLKWQSKSIKKDGSKRIIDDYWTFVVYNVYSRDNVYSYFYQENDGETTVLPYSIFDSILPAVTYHFKL
ncbi:MAG: TonB-dependent receptor [Marinoscillum sp.]